MPYLSALYVFHLLALPIRPKMYCPFLSFWKLRQVTNPRLCCQCLSKGRLNLTPSDGTKLKVFFMCDPLVHVPLLGGVCVHLCVCRRVSNSDSVCVCVCMHSISSTGKPIRHPTCLGVLANSGVHLSWCGMLPAFGAPAHYRKEPSAGMGFPSQVHSTGRLSGGCGATPVTLASLAAFFNHCNPPTTGGCARANGLHLIS